VLVATLQSLYWVPLSPSRTAPSSKGRRGGDIESQFEQIPKDHDIKKRLLDIDIDEIWSANTSCLEHENVIFTSLVMARFDHATICSLNVRRGEFWRSAELAG
jgi:hypothetical protein